MSNRVACLRNLNDEQYDAFLDLIEKSCIQSSPKEFKKRLELMRKSRIGVGAPDSKLLLRIYTGDPYLVLYIPVKEERRGKIYGEQAQRQVLSIFSRFQIPSIQTADIDSGDLYETLVFDRRECERNGLVLHPYNGSFGKGQWGVIENFEFPIFTIPTSPKERKRAEYELAHWDEQRRKFEIRNFGHEVTGHAADHER